MKNGVLGMRKVCFQSSLYYKSKKDAPNFRISLDFEVHVLNENFMFITILYFHLVSDFLSSTFIRMLNLFMFNKRSTLAPATNSFL